MYFKFQVKYICKRLVAIHLSLTMKENIAHRYETCMLKKIHSLWQICKSSNPHRISIADYISLEEPRAGGASIWVYDEQNASLRNNITH